MGGLAGAGYLAGWLYAPFRPGNVLALFPIFFATFGAYLIAVWAVLRAKSAFPRYTLPLIFGFAALFNLLLIPTHPDLSDDMFRYVWDGRVQAQPINPYKYPSNDPELAHLRDSEIWARMNRLDARTIYPPFAQMTYALTWRIFPDSVLGFKIMFIGCTFVAGLLLVRLLPFFGLPPERVLIFLWSPLLIWETAHAAHVEVLYLPFLIGAFLLRARGLPKREGFIGFLLGIATLTKLIPIILAPPLWSVRNEAGRRRWRLLFPITLILTVLAGYALYLEPEVDLLGFLPTYGREFFNIAPIPRFLIDLGIELGLNYWTLVNPTMYALVGLFGLYCVIVPARSAQEAIRRCIYPIGIYLIVNMNLFSWYVILILPHLTFSLERGRWVGFKLNSGLAWVIFSGLVMVSYNLFVTGWAQPWESSVQFIPLYGLLLLSAIRRFIVPRAISVWNRWGKGRRAI